MTSAQSGRSAPRFSPDGKSIAFCAGEMSCACTIWMPSRSAVGHRLHRRRIRRRRRAYTWAPDSKWLAYASTGTAARCAISYVVEARTAARAASDQLPGQQQRQRHCSGVRMASSSCYETSQRTETPAMARIDLMPRQPNYAEERFDDLFKPETAGSRWTRRRRECGDRSPRRRPSRDRISTIFVRAFRCIPVGPHCESAHHQPGWPSVAVFVERGRADESLSLSARRGRRRRPGWSRRR